MNVAELSVRSLEQYGEYESFHFGGRWYTNREMMDRAVRVAAGLFELGIRRGDRVAMVLANCTEVLNTFTGCFWMGAWNMPVMFTLTGEEMGYIFEDAAPSVAEAAVIGMPDDDYGEEVMAVVVPVPGSDLTKDGLLEHCRAHLGKFQVPKRVELVEELPKTAIGKMLKRELRRRYFGG